MTKRYNAVSALASIKHLINAHYYSQRAYLLLKGSGHEPSQFHQAVVDAVTTTLLNDLGRYMRVEIKQP